MEQKSFIKEITPEEVKTIDPYKISYISMKDGSVILVSEENSEKNYKIIENKEQNIYKIKEKKEQNSPKFNSEEEKTDISKIENEGNQYKDNDTDFNVYYSNRSDKEINKEKSNNFNIKCSTNNNSLYSYNGNNQNHSRNKKVHKSINNHSINYEQKNIYNINTKSKNNNINNLNDDDNTKKIYYIKNLEKKDNNSQYIIEKRKYIIHKRITEDIPIKKSKTKTNNYNTPIKENSIYIFRNSNKFNHNKNKNIAISYSSHIKNENNDRIYNYYKTPELKPRYLQNDRNIKYCTCNNIKNNFKNKRNLSVDNTVQLMATSKNYYNSYDNYKEEHRKYINNIHKKYNKYNKYPNRSFICRTPYYLLVQKQNSIYLRAKTFSYKIRNLGNNKKVNYKKNNKLNIDLRTYNHRFHDRKENRRPKIPKSNFTQINEIKYKPRSEYIMLKDLNGNIIHVFEDN